MKHKIRYATIGLLVGFFNGLIGTFGGLLSIIALKKYCLLSQKISQATTLSYIWILSLITIWFYSKTISIDLIILLYILIGGIIGSYLGTKLLNNIKTTALNFIFSIIMVITGVIVLLK